MHKNAASLKHWMSDEALTSLLICATGEKASGFISLHANVCMLGPIRAHCSTRVKLSSARVEALNPFCRSCIDIRGNLFRP